METNEKVKEILRKRYSAIDQTSIETCNEVWDAARNELSEELSENLSAFIDRATGNRASKISYREHVYLGLFEENKADIENNTIDDMANFFKNDLGKPLDEEDIQKFKERYFENREDMLSSQEKTALDELE